MKQNISDDAILRRRCAAMLRDHRRRAKALYQTVPVCIDQLVALVKAHPTCQFCGAVLTTGTFSIDHAMPISRRPDFALSNLRIVCLPCQQRKGALSEEEYKELLALISTWPPVSNSDLLRRLRAGTFRYAPSSRSRRKPTFGPLNGTDAIADHPGGLS